MANYQTKKELVALVKRFRKRIGIDPVWTISIKIIRDEHSTGRIPSDSQASIHIDDTHPQAEIRVRRSYLQQCKKYPRFIQRIIMHELLHIPIGEAMEKFKPGYGRDPSDKDSKVEEILVIRMARALVPLSNEDAFNEI